MKEDRKGRRQRRRRGGGEVGRKRWGWMQREKWKRRRGRRGGCNG